MQSYEHEYEHENEPEYRHVINPNTAFDKSERPHNERVTAITKALAYPETAELFISSRQGVEITGFLSEVRGNPDVPAIKVRVVKSRNSTEIVELSLAFPKQEELQWGGPPSRVTNEMSRRATPNQLNAKHLLHLAHFAEQFNRTLQDLFGLRRNFVSELLANNGQLMLSVDKDSQSGTVNFGSQEL